MLLDKNNEINETHKCISWHFYTIDQSNASYILLYFIIYRKESHTLLALFVASIIKYQEEMVNFYQMLGTSTAYQSYKESWIAGEMTVLIAQTTSNHLVFTVRHVIKLYVKSVASVRNTASIIMC